MLTIFLQRKSSNIPTKEACPPVISAASLVTSDPNVHNSKLERRRLRGSCLLRPHQVLYLRWDIRFHGINSNKSGNNSSLFWRTHQGTTRKSHKSPIATMPMKGCWACYKGCWGEWTVWAIPDHIYHGYTRIRSERMRPFTPWGGVDSPSIGAVSPYLGFWFLNPSAYQVYLHCIDCHILYILFFALYSVWGTTFSIPRFSLGCFENFLQVHSRDDRESMSLLFCLAIVKPLSLRLGLLLPTCFVRRMFFSF